MAQITNKQGDTITVNCGGSGGDNVLGTVEEKVGNTLVPVKDAKVTVSNMSVAGEIQDTTTNRNGKFDVDVDAACNHLIHVTATWTENGRRHVVSGSFRCPPCPKDDAGIPPNSDQRLALIDRLESRVEELVALQVSRHSLIAALQDQVTALVNNDLNALGQEGELADRKLALDQRISQELATLDNKIRSARASGAVPPSDIQWAIILELFELLKKLIVKAYWLQGMPAPELPPGGPGGIS